MERKKITFDSFIRGAIGCVLVVGILPIQAEVEKSYRLYPLCIIPDYSCRSILILSVSTANDFGNQQNE